MGSLDELRRALSENPKGAEQKILAFLSLEETSVVRAEALSLLASVYFKDGRGNDSVEAAEAAHREHPGAAAHAYTLAESVWRVFHDDARAKSLLATTRALERERSYIQHLADQLEGEIALANGEHARAATLLTRSLDFEAANYVQARGSLRLAGLLVDAGLETDASRAYLEVCLERCRAVDLGIAPMLAEPVKELLARLDR